MEEKNCIGATHVVVTRQVWLGVLPGVTLAAADGTSSIILNVLQGKNRTQNQINH